MSESGAPCRKWTDIAKNYSGQPGVGEHNYCRNPAREKDREFCYVSHTRRELCTVRSCGQYQQSRVQTRLDVCIGIGPLDRK